MSKQLGKHAIVGTFLAIAAVPSAQAADIPGSTKTKATLKVETANLAKTWGVFEKPNDSDWYRVSLTKGKHYYIAVDGPNEHQTAAIVRNSSGKELMRGLDDADVAEGYEFLAPYTGTYYIDYRVPGGFAPTSPPPWHSARVSTDCAGGAATTCVQQVGQNRKSLIAAAYDRDWFRASLSTGKTYTMKAESFGGCDSGFRLMLFDSSSKLIKQSFETPIEIANYRPPRNGTYFLALDVTDDCGTVYSLSLQTP